MQPKCRPTCRGEFFRMGGGEIILKRFNLERCRVCEEKAELEVCAHCDRKCCAECRRAHLDMLRRDLGRLLGQVGRAVCLQKQARHMIHSTKVWDPVSYREDFPPI